MRALLLVFLLLAVVAVLGTGATAADAPDFKKMKVKELKAWMKERSLVCKDCTDKEALVNFCIEQASAAPAAKKPSNVPDKPFWEVWSGNAKEICTTLATKADAGAEGEKVCDAIAVATDHFFMQHGKRTANKLKKKPDAMLKTSYGEIYYNAARRIFTRLSKHCLAAANRDACSSSSSVQKLMEKDSVKGAPFTLYMTNVGIENTNPMYDILNDKAGLARDEL